MKCEVCGQDNLPEARYCSRCGNTIGVVVTPPQKIGVASSYGHGWRHLWRPFWMLLLIGIIYYAISYFLSGISYIPNLFLLNSTDITSQATWAIGTAVFSIAYSILLVYPLGYGIAFAFLKAARAQKVEVVDMFAVFKNYWNVVLANLLVGLIVMVGFILLIVPGIIMACKLAFVQYLVVDLKMGVMEAIKESWRMTDGYAWKVFLIGLLAIPITIAGLICLGVGVIVAVMWINIATASLYYAIRIARSGSVQTEI